MNEHPGSRSGTVTRIVAAPGTGKTQAATTLATRLLAGVTDSDIEPAALVWCSGHRDAQRMRDVLVAASGRGVSAPVAMTPTAFALHVATADALTLDAPRPRLRSGADHDALLAQVLSGREARGANHWPAGLAEAAACEGFRAELRDVALVCDEFGVAPGALAELGETYDVPAWRQVADVMAETEQVDATSGDPSRNHAQLCRDAADVIAARGLPQPWRGLRTVIVDDAHELGPASVALLAQLWANGLDVVMFGDPDASTLSFRGAGPGLWLDPLGRGDDTPQQTLDVAHRHGEAIRKLAAGVSSMIGARGAVRQRSAQPSPDASPGTISVAEHRSFEAEIAWVATRFVQLYGDGVPWSQMAVIARTSSALPAIERALAAHGVPTGQAPRRTPLHGEYAVGVTRTACSLLGGAAFTTEQFGALLASDAVAVDPLYADEVMAHICTDAADVAAATPADIAAGLASLLERCDEDEVQEEPAAHEGVEASPVVQAVERLIAIASAAKAATQDVDAHHGLWRVWEAMGVAQRWQHRAIRGGRSGERADDDLDAMMALFDACERFVSAQPGASLRAFWRHLDELSAASDTLAAMARHDDAVKLWTPSLAAGREVHAVAIVGVQEGLWPNPTPRDSLLRAGLLADIAAGRATAARAGADRRAVLDDELRMLLVACTRARHEVLVSAVATEDEQSSVLLAVAGEFATGAPEPQSTASAVPQKYPPGPAFTVARLRAEVARALEERGDPTAAAAALVDLADAGIRGADPASWAIPPDMTSWRRVPDGEKPTLSPSAVQGAAECPLKWFWRSVGLGFSGSAAADLGTLIHEIAAEHPGGELEPSLAMLHNKWAGLGLADTWWARDELARAEEMVRKWCAYASAHADRVFDVERQLVADVGPARIRGFADRLEDLGDGRLRVVDIKTAKTAVTAAKGQTHEQLGAYQLALESGAIPGYTSAGGRLVFVGTSTNKPSLRDQDALAEHDDGQAWPKEMLEQVVKDTSGGQFEARTGPGCERCEFRSACPAFSPRAMREQGAGQ